ncbi:MAG: CBS domain-containing protein [Candidatus Hodarchaeota archaeon]
MKVRDLMIREVAKIKEDATIEEAVTILHKRHVGSIVIIDAEENCTGIFTERDAIRAMATRIAVTTALRDIMTKNVITIREDASYAEAKQLYKAHGIRHLPVINEKGHLVGMLSIRSILDELVEL